MRKPPAQCDLCTYMGVVALLAWLAACIFIAGAVICRPTETPKAETREIPIVYDK